MKLYKSSSKRWSRSWSRKEREAGWQAEEDQTCQCEANYGPSTRRTEELNQDINAASPPKLLAESSTLRNQTEPQSKTKIADIA